LDSLSARRYIRAPVGSERGEVANEFGVLDGRVALVTGASSGIGAGCAAELVARGARVLFTGRDERRLREQVEAAAAPDRCELLAADLTAADAPAAVVERCIERFGRLDVVVHSAGIYVNEPVDEATLDAFDRQHAVNVRAPYALTLAALPHLESGASIVFISSVFGQVGLAGASGYCATKGAIEQLTKTLSLELAPRGIRVNAVAPGFILTALNEANFGTDTEIRRATEADTPAGRIGAVGEIAPAVAYLASDEASFVHGATLVVDGGWAAR
jgi:NAD(P)-dependent dehydrogenase (short-subunit alcohol dehydrogenase family)